MVRFLHVVVAVVGLQHQILILRFKEDAVGPARDPRTHVIHILTLD